MSSLIKVLSRTKTQKFQIIQVKDDPKKSEDKTYDFLGYKRTITISEIEIPEFLMTTEKHNFKYAHL